MKLIDRLIFAAIAVGLFANALISFPIARAASELSASDIESAVEWGISHAEPIRVRQ